MGFQLSHITNAILPQSPGIETFKCGTAVALNSVQYMKFSSAFSHLIIRNDSEDPEESITFSTNVWNQWNPDSSFQVKPGEQFEADMSGFTLCYKKDITYAAAPSFRYVITGPVTRRQFFPVGFDNVTEFAGFSGDNHGSFTIDIKPTYIQLHAERVAGEDGKVSLQSKNGVDFTFLKTVYIECECSVSYPSCILRISAIFNEGANYSMYQTFPATVLNKSGVFTKQILAMDVSHLVGLGYIRVAAYADKTDGNVQDVKIFRIWGEV